MEPTYAIEAWLCDVSLPAPAPADLAAYVAHREGVGRLFSGAAARSALLRMAAMLVQMDAYLKESKERQRNYALAVTDTARTASVACERLAQQEGLVNAAVAWRKAHDERIRPVDAIVTAAAKLRDEADKVIKKIEARS